MAEQVWLPPAEWYASLPGVLVAAGGLITGSSGNVLLVKPGYRDDWGFPGGMVDEGEPPDEACAREVFEEVGLSVTPGRLLVVGWTPPLGVRLRPMLYLLFDCGTVPDDVPIRLQTEELDGHAFLPPDEATARLEPLVSRRLPAALRARASGQAEYLVTAP
ncbi:NUDIX domain-containing protein [Actinomadura scrupuli]|uniref:NUDIX domain-containing protein n=1 Tax=Actinomadura scrupuli TaxID=559629 RepID=UPI003D9723D6